MFPSNHRLFLFKSCNLWNLVSAVGRLWFYAACWQEALCRVNSSTCGKESVGKERHTDWSGLWITAAEKVKVSPSPLFCPLQVSVSAVYRLSRVTVTTVELQLHGPRLSPLARGEPSWPPQPPPCPRTQSQSLSPTGGTTTRSSMWARASTTSPRHVRSLPTAGTPKPSQVQKNSDHPKIQI